MDAPLKNDNWPIISASSIPWSTNNAVPDEITEQKMEEVLKQFVSSKKIIFV